MNSAAGAPSSICRASAELAAYDARMATPVACSHGPASSSSAFFIDAAAKTRTPAAGAVRAAPAPVPISTIARAATKSLMVEL